jgi:serine/threonine protein kinase
MSGVFLTQGQVLANRYRIVKLLGKGGYGAVYRAWDITLHQPCALKQNLATSYESQRQFEREAIILAGLRHAGLPRVTDHFVIPDQGQFLIMDFINGRDLEKIIMSDPGTQLEAQVVDWINQVCLALQYLHNHQPPVIHLSLIHI